MKGRESEEMYLETILLLKDKKGEVRSVDIVEELNYAKSSVSVAVHKLRQKDYITIDESGIINFTDKGRKKAQEVYERHRALTKLFVHMGASEELAEENACRMEHFISPELLSIIKYYLNKIN